jgi:signal peptidase I
MKKKKHLSDFDKTTFEQLLKDLEVAIANKDKKTATDICKNLEGLANIHFKKSPLNQILEFVITIAVALAIAVTIRQMWFEFYTIPSGSMRPTFQEGDFIIASKDDFGINVPLTPKQFYFDNDLVKRGEIVTFTAQNLDSHDNKMLYFYIFPGYKRYIKRLIAKPEDTIYFYGGKVYGIDKNGNVIKELQNGKWFEKNEYIPFISFEGQPKISNPAFYGIHSPVTLFQMNMPVAKLSVTDNGQVDGKMLPIKNSKKKPQILENYYDMWGMKNFAKVRILSKKQASLFYNKSFDANYYLELRHHPNLKNLKIQKDEYGRLRPVLSYETSLMPLSDKHLKKIFDNMYSARFTVDKNHKTARIGTDLTGDSKYYLPTFKNIPPSSFMGKYEFQDGIAYKIHFANISTKLPKSDPIYKFTPNYAAKLFNLGIEFYLPYEPIDKAQRITPSRYAYFNNNDLYLLGHKIIDKDDPVLVDFVKKEKDLQSTSSTYRPYVAFIDNGSPMKKDGTLDIELIKKNGLTIPKDMYLVLGDNHAMSADSRVFGFLPKENLRGGATLIFWPPGPRMGRPLQPFFHLLTFPRIFIWICGGIGIGITIYYTRKRKKLPLDFK